MMAKSSLLLTLAFVVAALLHCVPVQAVQGPVITNSALQESSRKAGDVSIELSVLTCSLQLVQRSTLTSSMATR